MSTLFCVCEVSWNSPSVRSRNHAAATAVAPSLAWARIISYSSFQEADLTIFQIQITLRGKINERKQDVKETQVTPVGRNRSSGIRPPSLLPTPAESPTNPNAVSFGSSSTSPSRFLSLRSPRSWRASIHTPSSWSRSRRPRVATYASRPSPRRGSSAKVRRRGG